MKTMLSSALAALVVLAVSACVKDTLDLQAGHCFTVSELLCSQNADVKCGHPADFEGQSLCLSGVLEPEDGLNSRFVLRDLQQDKRWIHVLVEDSIAQSVADFLRLHAGKKATVRGVMSGFDQPQNIRCKRGFEQQLSRLSDIKPE